MYSFGLESSACSFFHSFLFFSLQPRLSGNERPKNFVYSRNIGIPESSVRKLFLSTFFLYVFSRTGCRAIAAAGGTELFYENPVAESYWNWQAIA